MDFFSENVSISNQISHNFSLNVIAFVNHTQRKHTTNDNIHTQILPLFLLSIIIFYTNKKSRGIHKLYVLIILYFSNEKCKINLTFSYFLYNFQDNWKSPFRYFYPLYQSTPNQKPDVTILKPNEMAQV